MTVNCKKKYYILVPFYFSSLWPLSKMTTAVLIKRKVMQEGTTEEKTER